MPDSTAIAIVSIGASAATAICVPIVTHAVARTRDVAQRAHERDLQARELQATRSRGDVDELRALLDECVEHMTRALETYRELRSLVITQGASFDEPALAVARRFNEQGRQVDVDTARIAIRLGEGHPLQAAHRAFAEAMVEVVQHLGVAIAMGEHADLRETWDAVSGSADAFEATRAAFTTEAAQLVGSATLARP